LTTAQENPIHAPPYISMVFVRPTAQRTGVGLPLVLHIFDVARSMGFQRVGVWTVCENSPARGLYEQAGMDPHRQNYSLRSGVALQYESVLNDEEVSRA
jgi:GNAT superfamily N-acetyltransferase